MTRAFLIFTALFLLPAALHSECDYRLLSSQSFRLTGHDVVVDGDEVWMATLYGLAVYERVSGEPVGSIAIPGPTTEVEPAAGLVYAGSGSILYVITRESGYPAVAATLDLGSAIHDLLGADGRLWAATSAGVIPLDLSNPSNPVRGGTITTSGGGAVALAARGETLYVADGDNTVEVISTRNAVSVGSFSSQSRALTISAADGWLFVSDGIETQIFGEGISNPPRGGSLPFGTVAVIAATGDAVYAGGSDRRVRAIDLSLASSPITLFESELPASAGSVNRIEALATDGEQLFTAAGDLGLVRFDVSDFREPFPLRHYAGGPYDSSAAAGTRLYLAAGGLLESWSASADGTLTRENEWSAPSATIHDAAASPARVLTSTGPSLTLWDTGAAPSVVSAAAFRDTIASAVLVGTQAFVVLSDRSFWRADLTTSVSSPVFIPGTGTPSFVARGGSALALADLNDDGTTTVRFFPAGDPSAPAATAVLEGVATSGIEIAGDATVIAVTFRGITIVDFNAGPPAVSVIPGSNRGPARGLAIAGDALLVAGVRMLDVWDLDVRTLRSSLPLPSDAASLSTNGTLGYVAGADGVTVVNLGSDSRLPVRLPLRGDNSFHETFRIDAERLYLLEKGSATIRPLRWNGIPGTADTIPVTSGSIDLAAIGPVFFTLSVDGRVTGRDGEGIVLAEFQMSEGSDATALSLHAANGSIYLALSRGCLSGACEKKTLVLGFDGSVLTQTASLPGAIVDIVTDGDRGYAIFDDPDEIRILDLRDSLRPVTILSRPAEGDPVSIALREGAIHSLGRRLYVYDESSFEKRGELLDDYVADPSGRLTYRDQSVEIAGGCAIVAGRAFSPQVYEIRGALDWQPRASPFVPSPVREVISAGPRIYLLTGHSVEVWTLEAPPSRRRPAG